MYLVPCSLQGDANDGEDEDSEYLDFMLKVIDMARKQTLSRASQTFQVGKQWYLIYYLQCIQVMMSALFPRSLFNEDYV